MAAPSERNWPASKVSLWPLAKIKPYEKNPRTHPPAQIEILAASMRDDGVTAPILVDEEGIIIYGHGRRLAALQNGFKKYPVMIAEGWTEEQKKAIRIKDNTLSALSGWDKELLRSEIGDLKNSGYDVALLGFGDQQLVQFMTTPGPPDGFATFDENIPTKFCCPRCSYSWSGNPLAGQDPGEVKAAKKTKAK